MSMCGSMWYVRRRDEHQENRIVLTIKIWIYYDETKRKWNFIARATIAAFTQFVIYLRWAATCWSSCWTESSNMTCDDCRRCVRPSSVHGGFLLSSNWNQQKIKQHKARSILTATTCSLAIPFIFHVEGPTGCMWLCDNQNNGRLCIHNLSIVVCVCLCAVGKPRVHANILWGWKRCLLNTC